MKLNLWPWKHVLSPLAVTGKVNSIDVSYCKFVDEIIGEVRFNVTGENWSSEEITVRVDAARQEISWAVGEDARWSLESAIQHPPAEGSA